MRKNIILAFLSLIGIVNVFAQDFTVGCLTYNIKSLTEMTTEVDELTRQPLKEIVVPNAVEYKGRTFRVIGIGSSAFAGRGGEITDIKIEEGVEYIGNGVFSDCKSLLNIQIPNSIKTIGNYAFSNCVSLKEVKLPENCDLGLGVFKDCWELNSVVLSNDIQEIPKYMFENCWALKSIEIPETVRSIGYNAFYRAGLVSINIPASVEEIYARAFFGIHFQNVVIEDSEKPINFIGVDEDVIKGYINSPAFGECDNLYLGRLSYRKKVEDIEAPEYNIPTPRKKIEFGKYIKQIDDEIPRFSDDLEAIVFYSPEPPTLSVNYSYPLTLYTDVPLYVPCGSKDVYSAHSEWGKFWTINEGIPTNILDVVNKMENRVIQSYDMSGRECKADFKGIVIQRMKDGTVRKILKR